MERATVKPKPEAKPGPDPDPLIVDEDLSEALCRLLRVPPTDPTPGDDCGEPTREK